MFNSRLSSRLLVVSAIALFTLSGCASFDGAAKPVISVEEAIGLARNYSIEASLIAMAKLQTESDQQAYRNRVIAVNMGAIDARYLQFRSNLSREVKGGNFGLDSAILAVTGIGALSGKTTANILSATAAGLTGTKSALSKDLYFERTLPALMTSLETRRLKIKTEIVGKMKNESNAAYSLEEGFLDLTNYQMASSLDGALDQLSADASTQHVEQERKYNIVFEACNASEAVGEIWAEIVVQLTTMQDDTKLAAIADYTGAPKSTHHDTQIEAIRDTLNVKYCTEASAQSLLVETKK